MNTRHSLALCYSEQTACGSDTLAALLNSQRCVMKVVKIWHTVKAWVILTCVCVLVCVTLLQPPLYMKGKTKPTKVSRTVRVISSLCNCGNKKPWRWFTFENVLNPHFRKQAPTWNQTFCPKIFLSGQSGLKYRAMMTPALTVDIQAISIKAPTDTNRYWVSESRCYLEKF